MWAKVGAVAATAAIVVFLLFMVAISQGPPSAPTAAISATPNPSVASTYLVTLSFTEQSVTTPNLLGWTGPAVVYSAAYTNAAGTKVWLNQAQRVGVNVLSSTGSTYTMGTTVSLTVPAICTSCTYQILNVTVSAYAIVPSGWTSFTGSNSTYLFSSQPTYNLVPRVAVVNQGPYYLEVYGVLTAVATAIALCVFILKPNPYAGIIAVLAGAIFWVEVLVFIVVL